jgi:hypothetical protein
MKRLLLLTMAMCLVGLFLGSVALAQDLTVLHGTTIIRPRPLTVADLGPTGGPSLLLAAAALLLGTGVLTHAILRRRE